MTPQMINSNCNFSTAINNNVPLGFLLNQVGAKTKVWAGGMNVSVHMPGEGTRNFRYDFEQSIWFEYFEFDASRQISATAVYGFVKRISLAIQ